MKDFRFTPIDGVSQEQNPQEKYPKILKEALQVFECTWVKELDNAQDDKVQEEYDGPYHDFNDSCSRDNARTPMQWDASEYAGFSNVKPWLKVNENKSFINANEAMKDDNSIFHYYQKLIAFRKDNEVIKNGEYIDLLPNDNNVFAYERRLGELS